MRVRGLTASWCNKCAQAKKKLEGYDIEWLDIDTTPAGVNLKEIFEPEHLPFFVVGEDASLFVSTYNSYLEVKRILDNVNAEN